MSAARVMQAETPLTVRSLDHVRGVVEDHIAMAQARQGRGIAADARGIDDALAAPVAPDGLAWRGARRDCAHKGRGERIADYCRAGSGGIACPSDLPR